MGTRIRSARDSRVSSRLGMIWALALTAALARVAGAGQPATLSDDSGSSSSTAHAASDSTKKTAAQAPGASRASAVKAKTKPAVPIDKAASKTPAKAVANHPPVAKAAPPIPAKTAAIPAKTAAIPAKAAAIPAKTATVPAKTAAIPSKTATVPTRTAAIPSNTAAAPAKGAAIPSRTPAVASVAPAAKSTPAVTRANPGLSNVAMTKPAPPTVVKNAPVTLASPRTPSGQSSVASKTMPASLTSTVSRAAPAPLSGPTLARSGGTLVQGPASKTAITGPPAPPTAARTGAKAAGSVTSATAAATGAKGVGSAAQPTVSKSGGVVTPAPLEDHVTYQYNALGRRDPFQSLIDGGYVGVDVGGEAPPDVGGIKLVGVVWGTSDQFAMVEDVRGNSYVLRRGDRVMNGYVEGLKRDAMIVSITVDGQSESVTIPITRKGDKSNANR